MLQSFYKPILTIGSAKLLQAHLNNKEALSKLVVKTQSTQGNLFQRREHGCDLLPVLLPGLEWPSLEAYLQ